MPDDAYLKTVDRLEPEIVRIDAGAFYASAAISLKRIADALAGTETKMGLVDALFEMNALNKRG